MSWLRAQAFWAYYTAWDTSAEVGKTGDKANHTIKISGNGAAATTCTNSGHVTNHVELANGEYAILITAAEATADTVNIFGQSSTASIVIIPMRVGLLFGAIGLKRNTAFTALPFVMRDSTTGAYVAGKTVTVQRKIDGAAMGSGTLSNIVDAGSGLYTVDGAAADANGTFVTFKASATGCPDTMWTVVTVP